MRFYTASADHHEGILPSLRETPATAAGRRRYFAAAPACKAYIYYMQMLRMLSMTPWMN